MKANIKVIPNSKKDEIIKVDNFLKVRVKAPAVDGKANKAMIGLLADFFGVSKRKVVEVSV